jgi:tetratricopeptide (TPR) repeat protein
MIKSKARPALMVLLLAVSVFLFAQEEPAQPFSPPVQAQPVQPPVPVQPPATPAPDALQNYRVGRELETRGRPEAAAAYYAEAVRICIDELSRNPANMDSYTVLTWAMLRQRRYSEAVSWGERGLQRNPNDYRIIETLGEAYFYLSDYGRSMSALQRYVNAMPRGERASTAYFFMGEIYRNQQKFHHADIAYTTAVTLEGSLALWWFRLGSVRESAGEFAAAAEAYEKALSLNPGYREAAEAFERVRRQSPPAPQG